MTSPPFRRKPVAPAYLPSSTTSKRTPPTRSLMRLYIRAARMLANVPQTARARAAAYRGVLGDRPGVERELLQIEQGLDGLLDGRMDPNASAMYHSITEATTTATSTMQ